MQFFAGELYHIYNRGNNGQKIFFERENYLFFIRKIKLELSPLCDVLAYCLMPNHYHLLVRLKQNDKLLDSVSFPRKLGTLQSSYTRAINKSYQRHGSLFQQKAKSKNLEEYPHICFHYIHQNPVSAGLCSKLEDWEFSSFQDFMGLRNGKLPNQEMAFELLDIPKDRAALYKESCVGHSDKVIEKFY